jgi:hypothetical protein
METITNKLNKSKEYARLSMKILRAKRSGKSQEVINQLLTEREALKVKVGKYNSKYNYNNTSPSNGNKKNITEKDITRKYNSAGRKRKNNQPRIILGTSDFKKLRLNNAIIVDKSLLIKAILEAPSEVSLIARPRR